MGLHHETGVTGEGGDGGSDIGCTDTDYHCLGDLRGGCIERLRDAGGALLGELGCAGVGHVGALFCSSASLEQVVSRHNGRITYRRSIPL